MRVIVTGGRDYDDALKVFQALDSLNNVRGPIKAIIQGGAHGADELARSWAKLNQIPIETFAADWQGRGRRAGPERNSVMLAASAPDIVVAFPGGIGTADTIRKATRAGLEILDVA